MVRSEKDEVGTVQRTAEANGRSVIADAVSLSLNASAGHVDPEVSEKPTRRRFTTSYKLQIVREADASINKPGAVGALLRREGLYSSHLYNWRVQRDRGELVGIVAKKRGRVATPVNPLAKRVGELERDKRRLQRQVARQQLMLDVQKKVSQLLEIPLATLDDESDS
jgi:transposase